MTERTIQEKRQPEPERRGEDRQPLAGQVVVRFDDVPLIGSGQNLSQEGVFFVADGAVRVMVQMEGRDTVVGEVVRMTSMGDGRTGIAVAFLPPISNPEPLSS